MLDALLLYALMFFIIAASIGHTKSITDFLIKLGFKRQTDVLKDFSLAFAYLALFFVCSITISALFYYCGMSADVEKISKTLKAADVSQLIIILTIASFIEEFFFRGFLQRKTNILFASFVFAYFHIIYNSLSEVVGAFVLGLVLGKEYEQTKSIFAPILSHFFYNLITIALLFTTSA